jgi:8-oxo-dGTP diphosphatase
MPSKPFVLSVKALIRNSQGRYLVIRRSAASKHNAGLWDFPGGKTDPGETLDGALIREIQEETELRVELEHVVGAAESDLPDRKVAYLLLQARVLDGRVSLSEEHDDSAWVTAGELAKTDLAPQFRNFVRSLAEKR